MIVAGIGLRGSATLASLQSAYDLAGWRAGALAVVADKADLPALQAFAAATGLPLHPVPLSDLAGQSVQTLSPHQPARYGTGSVAEAAALAVAGRQARLVQARVASADGRATVAIAEGLGR